jgi:alcohol dehydrogenase class IV
MTPEVCHLILTAKDTIMRTTWSFLSAGHLVFGPGAVRQIGPLLARQNVRRAMIVTDPVLAGIGHAARVADSLAEAGIESAVSTGSEPEPSIEATGKVVEQARVFGPDAVVGLGGGSNIDVAKYTAVLCTHGGQLADYFGIGRLPGPIMPVIGVPTTAGTGSEVSHCAVLTDTANEMKVSSLSDLMRPKLAVVDPELTMTCPKQVTADSGIDALTHAVEAYTAVDYTRLDDDPGKLMPYDGRTPMGDIVAERAIELVGRHLVTAVHEPENLQARSGMALAATLAGLAFSNCGVALVHAMEYPLGGILHCSHGGGNGMLLPHVMQFNLPERVPQLARVAELLGEDVSGLASEEAAQRAVDAVHRLNRDIGVPRTIRDLGGSEDQLPLFAEKAFAVKRLMLMNGRHPEYEDVLDIYRAAF